MSKEPSVQGASPELMKQFYPDEAEERARRFTYQSPSLDGVTRHAQLSVAFIELATLVDQIVPLGRERSLVHTKLEEAKMWASAGVARNPETR